MKQIKDYIVEKYLISKDTKPETDPENPSTWDVGDILVGILSYSMTLVKFYKIKRRTAKKFDVVEVGQKLTKGSWMEGECIADPDKEGEKNSGRLNKWNRVVIDGYRCKFWDGQPVWFTHLD